jgi:hypothetical protein
MSNNNNENKNLEKRINELKENIKTTINKYTKKYPDYINIILKLEDVDLNKLIYEIVTIRLDSIDNICYLVESIKYLKKHEKYLDNPIVHEIVVAVLTHESEKYSTDLAELPKDYDASKFKRNLKVCKVSGGGKTRMRKRLRKRGTRR